LQNNNSKYYLNLIKLTFDRLHCCRPTWER